MTIKALVATLIGAIALQGAFAGTWSPPAGDSKIPVHCCDDIDDIGGSATFGYDTDYVFRGVRFARDSVWADVNYKFSNLPFSPTIGVWHLSSLGSGLNNGSDNYGDETDVYAGIDLPSVLGFDTSVGYTAIFLANQRGPSGGLGLNGDSTSRFSFYADRDLFAGISFGYAVHYDFGATVGDEALGSWYHEMSLSKSFDITDRVALDLKALVAYNDGYFSGLGLQGATQSSGFSHYAVSASLPVVLNSRATLSPYISYNGTPDGWSSNGVDGGVPGANQNDVLSGGVSVTVGF